MAIMIIHLRTWFSNLYHQKVVFCSAPKCVDNLKLKTIIERYFVIVLELKNIAIEYSYKVIIIIYK